jgi:signal transduction histidine kinase
MARDADVQDLSSAATLTPSAVTLLREQARVLASARASKQEADPVTIAGHAMDRHGVPLLRFILSLAALLIIYIDPSEPDRHVQSTYTTLTLYTIYSAAAYIAASMYNRPLPMRIAHWVDVGWYTVLISLSSGTNSLFFQFYFFAILVASFRRGAVEGLRVAVVSAVLFTSFGFAFSTEQTFELNRFLLRPIVLLVLGYMVAYWGGLEHRLKQRLALLRDVTVLRNPRFGVRETMAAGIEKLRAFYDADACLLVIADGADREQWLYQARRDTGGAVRSERCVPEMAATLLALPFTSALLAERRRLPSPFRAIMYVHDVVTRESSRTISDAAQVVVSTLDAPSVASVPVRYHHEAIGRLYVTARAGTFEISDLEFLSHVMDATLGVVENVRLVDRLASDAADNERQRIGRGIHDTVIQPYIGLQLGLRAISQRLAAGERHVAQDLARLVSLMDGEVARLRGYVSELKGATADTRVGLTSRVQRFARQFEDVTGIAVEVQGPAELAVSDRLAAELFEMTTEALSNVRRHTNAHHVAIGVERSAHSVSLRVENDGGDPDAAPFEPRSLMERAQALGGTLDIRRSPTRTAVVIITIPL